MQKSIKKTTKLYISIAVIIALVLAVTLSLYFTLGSNRRTSGNTNGSNGGKIETITLSVLDNGSAMTAPKTASSETAFTNLTVKNNSKLPVYVRAKVSMTSSVAGMYAVAGTDWVYAADNYLYYKNIVASGASTPSAIISGIEGFTGSVTMSVIAEGIQKEAAEPAVVVTGFGNKKTSVFSNGLLNVAYNVPALANKDATKIATIKNSGKLDLDVKFKLKSSEWTVYTIKNGSTNLSFEMDKNSGYYRVYDKLTVGSTFTITLIDANRNNTITAGATEIEFILQDYIVANDFYALVNSNLQNVGTKNANGTYTITPAQASNLYVYSYNNVPKMVFVQTTGVNEASYNTSGWGYSRGDRVAISSVIAPKSKTTSSIYASGWTPSGNLTVKVWTAIPVETTTIGLVKSNALKTSGDYYQPATDGSATAVTSDSLILSVSGSLTADQIKSAWGNIAIKSTDFSDLLVRASISLTWGTKSGSTWTANASQPELGFDISKFYGKGFAYNSSDESLTYSYNLTSGQLSSALLDFTLDATELNTMVNALKNNTSYGNAVKLTVFAEAVYAVGSQLDVIDLSTISGGISVTEYIFNVEGAKSLVQNQEFITYDGTAWSHDLSQLAIYATNYFPVGIRVAVALQYGTANNTTWTPSSDPNSTVDLNSYIDTTYWTFDAELGGYKYKYSLPGKAGTHALFTSAKIAELNTAINAELSSHSGQTARLVIMVETTHKV